MQLADYVAVGIYVVAWLFCQPLLTALGERRGRVINADMMVVRRAWMTTMTGRSARMMDGSLLGHALNSASFFASSNLLLIAAAGGVLFSGPVGSKSHLAMQLVEPPSRLVFELQIALVMLALGRGMLEFIWAIRQMNYCMSAIGAVPDPLPEADRAAFSAVLARLLNPALNAFNGGVAGYYFALAAAAWLFGPWALMLATFALVALQVMRQRYSPIALAISDLRKLLEARGPVPPAPPS